MGKLYIIATPLGNREDITLRALRLLKELSYFVAEDSREFRKLLSLYEIDASSKKVYSFAKHNMKQSLGRIVDMISQGSEVALVCDRGTPGISDPGGMLVEHVRCAGGSVIPVPGPSSVTGCFSVSGAENSGFLFLGFLPPTRKQRTDIFQRISLVRLPVILFEAPHRIKNLLSELKANFPQGKVFLAREMTKAFEEFQHFALSELEALPLAAKGEFTLVLFPNIETETENKDWREALKLRCLSDKQWAKQVGKDHSVASREVYNALQELKKTKRFDDLD